jgi:hypothetical protein
VTRDHFASPDACDAVDVVEPILEVLDRLIAEHPGHHIVFAFALALLVIAREGDDVSLERLLEKRDLCTELERLVGELAYIVLNRPIPPAESDTIQ